MMMFIFLILCFCHYSTCVESILPVKLRLVTLLSVLMFANSKFPPRYIKTRPVSKLALLAILPSRLVYVESFYIQKSRRPIQNNDDYTK